ncbi:hypothetical protein ACJX0J_011690, partial [Zea mays]
MPKLDVIDGGGDEEREDLAYGPTSIVYFLLFDIHEPLSDRVGEIHMKPYYNSCHKFAYNVNQMDR